VSNPEPFWSSVNLRERGRARECEGKRVGVCERVRVSKRALLVEGEFVLRYWTQTDQCWTQPFWSSVNLRTHSLTHSLALTHSLTLTHSLSLSHTHTHPLSRTDAPTLSHTLTHSLALTHSLSRNHPPTLSHSLTHSRALTLSLLHSLTHSLSHTHPPTLSYSLTHCLALTLSLSHSLSLSLSVSLFEPFWSSKNLRTRTKSNQPNEIQPNESYKIKVSLISKQP
jgi:hypothetical protein